MRLTTARVDPVAARVGEGAPVGGAEVDLARAPVVGHAEQVLGRVDDVAGDAEHLAQHVRRAAGQAGDRRRAAGEAVGDLVDRPVAAEGDDDVVALAGRLAAQLGGVAARLRVDRLDLVAPVQRGDDEVAQPRRHRGRRRVDDHEHLLALHGRAEGGGLGEADERLERGHYSQPRLRKNQSMPASSATIDADDDPERVARALARHADVHAPDARDERQRQDDDADRRQRLEDVVDAVREDRLVRRLEALDDLLEVLEHVPDALRRVVDVVEVDVQPLGDVALRALEVLQRGALRADDLAEVDDLLLDVGDVAHDLARAALPDLVLEHLELVAHLREHRKRRVDAVVDDLVEQVAGALGEQRVAHVLARLAALEEVLQRLDRLVGQRDDEVRARRRCPARRRSGARRPCRSGGSAGRRRGSRRTRRSSGAGCASRCPRSPDDGTRSAPPATSGRPAGAARCGSSAAPRPRRARRSGPPPRPPGARRRARAPRTGRPNRGFGRFGMADIVPFESWTHPEGWRDRPNEAPATNPQFAGNGANSC